MTIAFMFILHVSTTKLAGGWTRWEEKIFNFVPLLETLFLKTRFEKYGVVRIFAFL